MANKIELGFEKFIFASRWLQAPIYAGLVIGALLFSYKFLVELIHLATSVNELTDAQMMLGVLTLVDITMVVNLLVMVVIGGYSTFVSRIDLTGHEDKPEWLQKVDAGSLKVKLATSLVGVSGVHLLQTFINMQNQNLDQVKWQVIIHVVFLLSAILLAFTEHIMHKKH